MAETVIRNDLRSAEVLELGCIRASLGCKADQFKRTLQAAVVVGSNVCDEIGGVVFPDQVFANL